VDAAFNLGILYAGRDDDAAALTWYERAASGGHTEAALQVAIACLRDGDERTAERHLRCSAGGGSVEAAYRLAMLLDARRPPASPPALGEAQLRTEKTECELWYERAAEQGHVRAQVRAGMLAARRGDIEGAARWYRESAEAGSRSGAFNLGLLLVREGSEAEAVLWWTRAARAGHGRAALRLALLAARSGELAEGERWCARAVELGPAEVAERAAKLLDALHQELTA
jgi:TPR repeat protein